MNADSGIVNVDSDISSKIVHDQSESPFTFVQNRRSRWIRIRVHDQSEYAFGFCESRHLMKRFSMGKSTCYAQINILQRLDLIIHRVTLSKRSGAYSLTQKGVKYLGNNLPYLSKIPLSVYFHHMVVLDVYLDLINQYPMSEWITERHLIRQKQENLAGTKLHLPDGVLVLPAQGSIAIEVEITLKANARLLDIFTDYAIDNTYTEIWYFCSPQIVKTIQEIARVSQKIKIHTLHKESI